MHHALGRHTVPKSKWVLGGICAESHFLCKSTTVITHMSSSSGWATTAHTCFWHIYQGDKASKWSGDVWPTSLGINRGMPFTNSTNTIWLRVCPWEMAGSHPDIKSDAVTWGSESLNRSLGQIYGLYKQKIRRWQEMDTGKDPTLWHSGPRAFAKFCPRRYMVPKNTPLCVTTWQTHLAFQKDPHWHPHFPLRPGNEGWCLIERFLSQTQKR